jgi:hypothetical protein
MLKNSWRPAFNGYDGNHGFLWPTAMRAFTTNDLNKQVGEVTDAATKLPVLITRHRKPRFVMMS